MVYCSLQAGTSWVTVKVTDPMRFLVSSCPKACVRLAQAELVSSDTYICLGGATYLVAVPAVRGGGQSRSQPSEMPHEARSSYMLVRIYQYALPNKDNHGVPGCLVVYGYDY